MKKKTIKEFELIKNNIIKYIIENELNELPENVDHRHENNVWGIITKWCKGIYDSKFAFRVKMAYERNSCNLAKDVSLGVYQAKAKEPESCMEINEAQSPLQNGRLEEEMDIDEFDNSKSLHYLVDLILRIYRQVQILNNLYCFLILYYLNISRFYRLVHTK
jgi:hypothetical protein